MQVFRATDSKVVAMMHFFDEGDSSAHDDGLELFTMMNRHHDKTCVSVILDNNEIVGHTCGHLWYGDKYVWSFNSWVKKGVPKEYVVEGLDIIKQWSADNFNIHEIRCETFRNPEAMHRAYKWNKYSTIMTLEF